MSSYITTLYKTLSLELKLKTRDLGLNLKETQMMSITHKLRVLYLQSFYRLKSHKRQTVGLEII